jgi:hypothetical protein
MEQSPSWEANSRSAGQKIPCILEPEGSLLCYKSPPLVPALCHMNSVRILVPFSYRSILILASHRRLDLPSGIFPSGFPVKILYAHIFFCVYVTWPAHLILLYLAKGTNYGAPHNAIFSSLKLLPVF